MQDYLKTTLLLGSLSILIVLLGGYLGGQDGVMVAFVFSLVLNVGMYFFSDKIALAASGAKPLSPSESPETHQLVRELAHKLKMPMPKLFKIPTQQANAFATGRGPGNASVAVTDGILKILTKEELKGVLAHELGHIKNRDILISTIAAVLASTVTMLSHFAYFGGGSDDDNRPAALGIFVALLAPLAGTLIQLAISRNREFEADETGAETLRDGDPLASALLKIHASTKHSPMRVNPAFSSLYIANPLGGMGGIVKLFSTHPPVEERVKKLKEFKF